MIVAAIILFAVAAVLGIINLVRIVATSRAPRLTVFLHGPVAFVGVILLLIFTFFHLNAAPVASLIVFAVAAVGGFTLFIIDISTQKPPKWLGFVHGIVAEGGFVLLLIFAFG